MREVMKSDSVDASERQGASKSNSTNRSGDPPAPHIAPCHPCGQRSIGALLSISALLLEEISCQTYRWPDNLFALVCMAIAENFSYHQLVLVWRLEGSTN
jgi:hypothetical protein